MRLPRPRVTPPPTAASLIPSCSEFATGVADPLGMKPWHRHREARSAVAIQAGRSVPPAWIATPPSGGSR